MDIKKFLEKWALMAGYVMLLNQEELDFPKAEVLVQYAKENPNKSFDETLKEVSPLVFKHKDTFGAEMLDHDFFDPKKSMEANWKEFEQAWKESIPRLIKEQEAEKQKVEIQNQNIRKENILGADDNVLEEEKILGADDNVLEEEKILGADDDVLEEEKILGADDDVLEEEKILGADDDVLEEEKILGADDHVSKSEQSSFVEEEDAMAADLDNDHPENGREMSEEEQIMNGRIPFPQNHDQVQEELRNMSERIANVANIRREARTFLKSEPNVSTEDLLRDRLNETNERIHNLENGTRLLQGIVQQIRTYLSYENRNPGLFNRNEKKQLRKFLDDIQTNLEKNGILDEKIKKESRLLKERADEMRNPEGSGHSFEEAVEMFRAIQDKSLSWRRSGGHAQQFNAIKDAVRALQDPNNNKSETERKADVYKACDAYLREHSADGRHIGGQGSEVGRLRKQAVVNLLQVLSKDEAVQNKLRSEKNQEGPERVKLNFAALEKSLAKKSEAKTEKNKYLVGTKKKAYAELKTAKEKADLGRRNLH